MEGRECVATFFFLIAEEIDMVFDSLLNSRVFIAGWRWGRGNSGGGGGRGRVSGRW